MDYEDLSRRRPDPDLRPLAPMNLGSYIKSNRLNKRGEVIMNRWIIAMAGVLVLSLMGTGAAAEKIGLQKVRA